MSSKPKTPEGAIKKAIKDYLSTVKKCEVFPYASNGMWDAQRRIFRTSAGRVGTPDLLLCYRGRFLGLEIKTGQGRLSQPQRECIRAIDESGGRAVVVRSVQDVIDFLSSLSPPQE